MDYIILILIDSLQKLDLTKDLDHVGHFRNDLWSYWYAL